MSRQRTAFYYMTADERREYFRIKQNEYAYRKAELMGRTRQKRDPNSHPSLMTHEERLAYNRECLRRYKERQRYGEQPKPKLRAKGHEDKPGNGCGMGCGV